MNSNFSDRKAPEGKGVQVTDDTLSSRRPSRRSWWRRLFAAGVFVAVISVDVGARAGEFFVTGNELNQLCESDPNSNTPIGTVGRFECLAYVVAVADAMAAGAQIAGWTACPPHVSREQVVDVAKRFLATHPEIRHTAGVGLVAQALAEAFPCR